MFVGDNEDGETETRQGHLLCVAVLLVVLLVVQDGENPWKGGREAERRSFTGTVVEMFFVCLVSALSTFR
jgi:hypothetical protein